MSPDQNGVICDGASIEFVIREVGVLAVRAVREQEDRWATSPPRLPDPRRMASKLSIGASDYKPGQR